MYSATAISAIGFSRRVVGWQLSKSLRTDLALDALEMGIWTRRRAGRDLGGLTTKVHALTDGRGRVLVVLLCPVPDSVEARN